MTKNAYRSGYEIAKAYLIDGDTKGLHHHMAEMQSNENYFEGIAYAIWDFENGCEWEF